MSFNKQIILDIGNLKIIIKLLDGFFNLSSSNPNKIIHVHTDYEMHFAIKNTSFIRTDNTSYVLSANDICLIPPGKPHKCIMGSSDSVKSSLSFSFKRNCKVKTDDLYTPFSEIFLSVSDPLIFKRKLQSVYLLRGIISDFYIENTFSEYKLKSMLSAIFLDLAHEISYLNKNDIQPYKKITPEPLFDNDIRPSIIEDYMNSNYMNRITLESLSRVLHTSEKQTNRIIKSHLNMNLYNVYM